MTTIVEMMEYIYPDIDVHFGSTWDWIVRAFSKYNVWTLVKDRMGFSRLNVNSRLIGRKR
jgi:hypothetical protein